MLGDLEMQILTVARLACPESLGVGWRGRGRGVKGVGGEVEVEGGTRWVGDMIKKNVGFNLIIFFSDYPSIIFIS